MLATLVIFLREGVEASMIVAILLAYLNRLGKREYFRDVFLGVGAALLLAAGQARSSTRPFGTTAARAARRSSRPSPTCSRPPCSPT